MESRVIRDVKRWHEFLLISPSESTNQSLALAKTTLISQIILNHFITMSASFKTFTWPATTRGGTPIGAIYSQHFFAARYLHNII